MTSHIRSVSLQVYVHSSKLVEIAWLMIYIKPSVGLACNAQYSEFLC